MSVKSLFPLLLGLCVLTSALAPAPTKAEDEKTIVVQLQPMLVPADSGRRNDYTSITPLVEAKPGIGHTEICTFSARVREAILLTLDAHPVRQTRDDEYIIAPKIHKLLVQRINAAVGGDKVSAVHIISAALSLGGGWQSRLPFATVAGCREFKQMEENGGAAAPASGGH